jgi:membrane associated rhomboid family serine protease
VQRDVSLYQRSWWALAIVAALVGFFLITGPSQARSPWFLVGTADSQAILSGAVYESVTALTLHATPQHLLGNAIVGGLFLTVLHRRFGAGLGTFLVVTAGAAGNLMNAAWHGAGHRSLGASTAVMAALAALAVTQFVLDRTRQPNRKIVLTWAPILAGLALLGTFGASPDSDLHAHGFGFVAGLVFGMVAAFPLRRRATPLPTWTQVGFGIATIAVVAGSWAAAFGFRAHGG